MSSSTAVIIEVSLMFPPVIIMPSGRPRPSQTRCSLVVRPPRDRPIPRSGGSNHGFLWFGKAPCVPLQGRAMLMHTGDRRVDRDSPVDLPCPVRLLRHLGEQLLPGAILGPSVEPLVDRVPLP